MPAGPVRLWWHSRDVQPVPSRVLRLHARAVSGDVQRPVCGHCRGLRLPFRLHRCYGRAVSAWHLLHCHRCRVGVHGLSSRHVRQHDWSHQPELLWDVLRCSGLQLLCWCRVCDGFQMYVLCDVASRFAPGRAWHEGYPLIALSIPSGVPLSCHAEPSIEEHSLSSGASRCLVCWLLWLAPGTRSVRHVWLCSWRLLAVCRGPVW